MTGKRTEAALARIEASMRRIQLASARVQAVHGEQARRNDRLRQAITEALRDLDLLMAEGEQP